MVAGPEKERLLRSTLEVVAALSPEVLAEFLEVRAALGFERAIGAARLDVLCELRAPGQIPDYLEVPRHQRSRRRIVTGSVSAANLERLRQDPLVRTVELPRRVLGESDQPPAPASPAPLSATESLRDGAGEGTLLVVVDDSLDPLHESFRTEAGTRLVAFWDQGAAGAQGPFGYGRVHDPAALDAAHTVALERGRLAGYRHLGYEPVAGGHATHVLDLAAGNGRDRNSPRKGRAHAAELLFVQLPRRIVAVPYLVANARQVLDGIDFGLGSARPGQPVIVNVSLAVQGGPHDGTTMIERGIEELVALAEEDGRSAAILLAAGNSFQNRCHRRLRLSRAVSLPWEIRPASKGFAILELYYEGGPIEVGVALPDGTIALPPSGPAPGPARQFPPVADTPIVSVDHDQTPEGTGRVRILVTPTFGRGETVGADRATPAGAWRVLLRPAGAPAVVHAWIERDDIGRFGRARQSYFAGRVPAGDRSYTVSGFAGARGAIVVGAHLGDTDTPCSFSSAGPLRNGGSKPDLAAPGEARESLEPALRGFVAAGGRAGPPVRLGGTSQAVALASGLASVLAGSAAARGGPLPPGDIRTGLFHPRPWNARLGFGRLRG